MGSVSITVRVDEDLAEAYGYKRYGLSSRVRAAMLAGLPMSKKLNRVRTAASRAAKDMGTTVELGSSGNVDAVVERIDGLRREITAGGEEPDREW